MKKIVILLTALTLSAASFAQTAKSVLDKAAAIVSNKDGVQANFTMTLSQGATNGTIAVKGNKFQATTPQAIMWFDGKTQWTYMKKNDEVNVTTPTAAQLQAINPYNFINLYKAGYKYTMNTSGNDYVVHLTATDKASKMPELFITVDKKTYHPKAVKLLHGTKWTNFTISNLKQVKLSDAKFRFSSKDYPTAEVIDLR